MTDSLSSDPAATPAVPPAAPAPGPRWSRPVLAAVAAALILTGLGVGASAERLLRPEETQTLLEPIAVTALSEGDLGALKGQVMEVYGDKFILQDATGRALIETGPSAKDGSLVTPGEVVTAQGDLEDGLLRARLIVRADGTAEELHGHPFKVSPELRKLMDSVDCLPKDSFHDRARPAPPRP